MLSAFVIGNSCIITTKNKNIKQLFPCFIENLDIHTIVIKQFENTVQTPYSLTIINIHFLRKGYIKLFDTIYKKVRAGDISYIKSMLIPSHSGDNFLTRKYLEYRVVAKKSELGEHIYTVGDNACIYPPDSFNVTREVVIADILNNSFFDTFKVPYISHYNTILNSVTKIECELAMFLIKESLELWIKERQKSDQNTIKIIQDNIYKIGIESYENNLKLY